MSFQLILWSVWKSIIYYFIKGNMKKKRLLSYFCLYDIAMGFPPSCLKRVWLLLLNITIQKLWKNLDFLKNSKWLKVKSCISNFLESRSISQELSAGSFMRIWSNFSSCLLGKKPEKLAGRLPACLSYLPLMWWIALHLLIRNCWHVSFLSCTTQLN